MADEYAGIRTELEAVQKELAKAYEKIERLELVIKNAVDLCQQRHTEVSSEMGGNVPQGRYAYLKAQSEVSREIARALGTSLTIGDIAPGIMGKFRGFKGFGK